MKLTARSIDNREHHASDAQSAGHFSFLKFLVRYPLFFLAFGPPIYRSSAGIDATKGIIDFWSFLQVSLLGVVALRAIGRLSVKSIFIPKQVRSVLIYAFFLGISFLVSSIYSTSRSVSAAYSILYFLTFICVAEFIVDVYRNPPNWMQAIFYLRYIALILFALVVITIPFNPQIVMAVIPGVGIRLNGGTVAPVAVICPIIAIISSFAFLHGLESKAISTFFFLVGLTGTLVTQTRGAELALLFSLAILIAGWAKTGRRSAYIFISGTMTALLLSGIIAAVVGGGRIWSLFNRGESAQNFTSGSGRTDIWKFVIQYCMAHPQGMGYIAGFRTIFKEYFALGLMVDVTHIGNSHNAFVDILADAGWLALALYLIMMMKIVAMGWRFGKERPFVNSASDNLFRQAIRCALILLFFCFACGMDTADFSVPLKTPFHLQNIIIAIILGVSASTIAASRTLYRTPGN